MMTIRETCSIFPDQEARIRNFRQGTVQGYVFPTTRDIRKEYGVDFTIRLLLGNPRTEQFADQPGCSCVAPT